MFASNQGTPTTRTARYVYPTLADGVTLQTAEGDWVLGGMTEIIPKDTIDRDFTITAIVIEKVNRPNKTHELILYAGEDKTEVARRRFVVNESTGIERVDIDVRTLPADTPVFGRMAIQGPGAKYAVISLQYEA